MPSVTSPHVAESDRPARGRLTGPEPRRLPPQRGDSQARSRGGWPTSRRYLAMCVAASRAVYNSLPHVRVVRTASLDLCTGERPVEAVLALAVHRGITS